jgi:hypothetical protein
MPRKKDDFYVDAERLYVQDGKTTRDIAAVLPVSPSTVSRWARDGNWKQRRCAYLESAKSALDLTVQTLHRKVGEINALPIESVDAETIKCLTALVSAVEKLRRTYRPFELAVLTAGLVVEFGKEKIADVDERTTFYARWNEFVEWAKDYD